VIDKITNEMEVVIEFASQCQNTGWKIISAGVPFPDAEVISPMGRKYSVEFEFVSSNFRSHGHDPRLCDLIICYENDWLEGGMPTIELSNTSWFSNPVPEINQDQKEIIYLRIENSTLSRRVSSLEREIADMEAEDESDSIVDGARIDLKSYLNLDTPIKPRDLIYQYGIPRATAYRWYSTYEIEREKTL
jgi:hypothetical protein